MTTRAYAPEGRIAVIGCGLLGASLAAALRRTYPDIDLLGVDRDVVVDMGQRSGLLDDGGPPASLEVALDRFDPEVVVLGCPLDAIVATLPRLATWSSGRSRAPLVFDLGSVKRTVIDAAQRCGVGRFVGAHPMAGSERSGIEHADPLLFDGAPFVICEEAPRAERELVARLVEDVGARPLSMTAEEHDRVVALTSHLPHLLAYDLMSLGYADAADDLERPPWSVIGGSWRDLTRVAASSPELWEQIFAHNRGPLLARLDAHIESLSRRRESLAAGRPTLVTGDVSAAELSRLCRALRKPPDDSDS